MSTNVLNRLTHEEMLGNLFTYIDSEPAYGFDYLDCCMFLRALGYWCSPHVLRSLVALNCIPAPTGQDIATAEFFKQDILNIMAALDERHMWLALADEHNHKRTRKELLAVVEKRPRILEHVSTANDKPIHEVIEFLLDEPDKDLQRMIFVAVKDRILTLEMKTKAEGHGDDQQ